MSSLSVCAPSDPIGLCSPGYDFRPIYFLVYLRYCTGTVIIGTSLALEQFPTLLEARSAPDSGL